MVAWVVPRLAWIIGALAACVVLAAVLALVVVPRLARWSDRRDAVVYAAARPAQLTAEPARTVQAAAERARQLRSREPPTAIANHYGPEFNIYGDAGQQAAARLIRQALTPEPSERS